MKNELALSLRKKHSVSNNLLIIVSFLFIITSCRKDLSDQQGRNAGISNSQTGSAAANIGGQKGVNVVLNTPVTDAILNDLGKYGTVQKITAHIKALTMRTANLSQIQKLSYVSAANEDVERRAIPVSNNSISAGAPIDAVSVTNFSGGISTWNLDAINVTNFGMGRTIAQDGSGVFVGVLDTGLPDSWRQLFPQERIATQYATSFGGGGGEMGNVSEQPNKWEHDQNTHGGHVTSTILGYQLGTTTVNGVAPKANVIPVKVLNQNGSGWSSVVARGIVYIADLKAGPLANSPVVINMSLGGPDLDAMEKAAMDYAISKGVIIVASAGNEGQAGMGYPGAYAPVISVAAAGWVGQWKTAGWWSNTDVYDPTRVQDFYIASFSSREKPGQDLDVAAPGEWVVGPYQLNSGKLSYYYLSGTSMASPHVAGIVALMAQKKSGLTAAQAEAILESAALPMPAGSLIVSNPSGTSYAESWGADATGKGFITADAAVNAVK